MLAVAASQSHWANDELLEKLNVQLKIAIGGYFLHSF
jgi:hypothetical protein